MRFINLMKNRLNAKEVNKALQGVDGTEEAVAELEQLIGATPLPAPYTSITQAIEGLAEGGGGSTDWQEVNWNESTAIDLSSFKEVMVVIGTHHTGGGICFSNIFTSEELTKLPNVNSDELFTVGGYYRTSSDSASARCKFKRTDTNTYWYRGYELYINGSSVAYGQCRIYIR